MSNSVMEVQEVRAIKGNCNVGELIKDYMSSNGEKLQIDYDVNNLDDSFLNLVASKVKSTLSRGTFTSFEDVIKYQLTMDLADETNDFAKKKYLVVFDALTKYENDHHLRLNLDDNNVIDEAYATINHYHINLEFKGLDRLLGLMTNGKEELIC